MMPSEHLVELLRDNARTVVLTGAGVSAESGVPTFRSGSDSLWSKFSPEELASIDGFMANPKLVWEWYSWRRRLIGEAQPNPGHEVLAKLEKHLSKFTLVTQNVDNLHQRAGSEQVIELHGNIHKNKCLRCGRPAPESAFATDHIPKCTCGGMIRPDVVWFGELLPEDALNAAIVAAGSAELFMSIGTSAAVFPAADLPVIAKRRGAYLVEINLEETRISPHADEVYHAPSGVVLSALWDQIRVDDKSRPNTVVD